MERGFYNEDIEELLKEKADQYKMYPSDKVWKGIHRSLHPNRKWYWLSLILFLGAVGYYTFIEFITPSTSSKALSENNPASNISKSTEATTESNNNKPAVIVPFGNPKQPAKQKTFVLNPDNNETNKGVVITMNQPAIAATTTTVNIPENHSLVFNNETPVYDLNAKPVKKFWQPEQFEGGAAEAKLNDQTHQVPAQNTLTSPTSIDESKLGENTHNAGEDHKRLGWLANNAVYELKVPKQKRVGWQLTFTPTMNYRTWKGSNHPSDMKTLPLVPVLEGDPEKYVNHKQALGFEVGSNILYTLNKTFTLKAGLLFNYTRYDIQAYSSSDREPATIALNSNMGIATGDLTTYTRYRNFGGNPEDLHNQYFQLSTPLGLEINLLFNDKIQVGICGTVQPTYLLNRKS